MQVFNRCNLHKPISEIKSQKTSPTWISGEILYATSGYVSHRRYLIKTTQTNRISLIQNDYFPKFSQQPNKQGKRRKFEEEKKDWSAWRTLGPRIWEDFRRIDGSGKDLPPMDLRSILASSNSTELTTAELVGSSAKADWIMIMAFSWSKSLKHHPLVLRVSITVSVQVVEEPPSISNEVFQVQRILCFEGEIRWQTSSLSGRGKQACLAFGDEKNISKRTITKCPLKSPILEAQAKHKLDWDPMAQTPRPSSSNALGKGAWLGFFCSI